jgi:hypothetical protein
MKIIRNELLTGMINDDYFPKCLVEKIREILIGLCGEIEKNKPINRDSLLYLTDKATDKINDLENEFIDNDSEIETAARDDIAISFKLIAHRYGFNDIDTEDLIRNRNW